MLMRGVPFIALMVPGLAYERGLQTFFDGLPFDTALLADVIADCEAIFTDAEVLNKFIEADDVIEELIADPAVIENACANPACPVSAVRAVDWTRLGDPVYLVPEVQDSVTAAASMLCVSTSGADRCIGPLLRDLRGTPTETGIPLTCTSGCFDELGGQQAVDSFVPVLSAIGANSSAASLCTHSKPGYAVAEIFPLDGFDVRGTVTVSERLVAPYLADSIILRARLSGFDGSSEGGVHIHEGRDCSDAGKVLRGPEGEYEQNPWSSQSDPYNENPTVWNSDDNGNARSEFMVHGFSVLRVSPVAVAGRVVVVHSAGDNINAENVIACGVLRLAEPQPTASPSTAAPREAEPRPDDLDDTQSGGGTSNSGGEASGPDAPSDGGSFPVITVVSVSVGALVLLVVALLHWARTRRIRLRREAHGTGTDVELSESIVMNGNDAKLAGSLQVATV